MHESVTENPADQPLLWAILEMREAVVRLVDEQKSRVLTRVPLTDSAGPEPGTAFGYAPPVVKSQAEPGPAHSPPEETVPNSPPKRGPSARHRPFPKDVPSEPDTVNVSMSRPSPALVESQPPESSATAGQDGSGRSEDPRQRLDALARLLDKRVKSSHAPASESPGRSGET